MRKPGQRFINSALGGGLLAPHFVVASIAEHGHFLYYTSLILFSAGVAVLVFAVELAVANGINQSRNSRHQKDE